MPCRQSDRPGTTDQRIGSSTAPYRVIAALAIERLVGRAAQDRVGEVGPANGVDAGERIGSDIRSVSNGRSVRIPGHQIDGHPVRRVGKCNSGIPVSGNRVVTAHPFDFIEGP